MKRLLLITVLTAIAMILTACSNELTAGVIIDKKYIPARTYSQSMIVGRYIIPQIRTMPAAYRICVQGVSEKGETVAEWWSVDAIEYGRLQVGMNVMRRG